MLTVLAISWWAYVVLLALVILRLGPAALRSFRSTARHLDFLWLLILGMALNRVWFAARHTQFPPQLDRAFESESLIIGYVTGIGLALAVLHAFHWYTIDDA